MDKLIQQSQKVSLKRLENLENSVPNLEQSSYNVKVSYQTHHMNTC